MYIETKKNLDAKAAKGLACEGWAIFDEDGAQWSMTDAECDARTLAGDQGTFAEGDDGAAYYGPFVAIRVLSGAVGSI